MESIQDSTMESRYNLSSSSYGRRWLVWIFYLVCISWTTTIPAKAFSQERVRPRYQGSISYCTVPRPSSTATTTNSFVSSQCSITRIPIGKPSTTTMKMTTTTMTTSPTTTSDSLTGPPAFIIEKVSSWSPPPTEATFQQIASMCIPVFFDEQNNTNRGPRWLQQFKLNYLQNLQAADLRVRRNWYPTTNEMFVAYEVTLAEENDYLFRGDDDNGDDSNTDHLRTTTTTTNPILSAWRRIKPKKGRRNKKRLKPLILDTDQIYNLSSLRKRQNWMEQRAGEYYRSGDTSSALGVSKSELFRRLSKNDNKNSNTIGNDNDTFVKGEILGFVEITQKPYGLGLQEEEKEDTYVVDDDVNEAMVGRTTSSSTIQMMTTTKQKKKQKSNNARNIRPVLTNLAVAKRARKLGIGSLLVDRCEDHIRNVWRMNDLVLEVEDYNDSALRFYMKRGFKVLYSDPASRRYDLSGLFPEKVRCRREILRKVLGPTPQSLLNTGSSTVLKMGTILTRIQQLVENRR